MVAVSVSQADIAGLVLDTGGEVGGLVAVNRDTLVLHDDETIAGVDCI